jgi:hypothetical protein
VLNAEQLEQPTMDEGVFVISLNFLANPKSHSCIAQMSMNTNHVHRKN